MRLSSRWQWASSFGLAVVVVLALTTFPSAGQIAPTGNNQPVTFTKDIAPILQQKCQTCHRPDSLAPMSLVTYEEVRPFARAMKAKTSLRGKQGVMPPWHVEKGVGIQHYKDDISLTEEQITTIAKWADNGAPQGKPEDMPPPVKFTDPIEWTIEPDLIVSSPQVEVAAAAPDWYGRLPEEVPTGLTEDRYVAAVQTREVNDQRGTPGRRTSGGIYVVHHLAFRVIGPDGEQSKEPWSAHQPGQNVEFFTDRGLLLKAGSKILFDNIHLHSNGTETKARVEWGFKFHPKGYQPQVKIQNVGAGAFDLDIKGMEANQRFEGFNTLTEHTRILNFKPHMHATGVRICLDAIWGNTVETLTCAGYDHGWLRVYTYEEDWQPLLPKGTILRVTGYHDNTPTNKNVAEPRNWTGAGHRAIDNMMIGGVQGVHMTDAEFEAAILKRRQTHHLADGQRLAGCLLCGTSKPPVKARVTSTAEQQQQP
jgi:hypothetical protein